MARGDSHPKCLIEVAFSINVAVCDMSDWCLVICVKKISAADCAYTAPLSFRLHPRPAPRSQSLCPFAKDPGLNFRSHCSQGRMKEVPAADVSRIIRDTSWSVTRRFRSSGTQPSGANLLAPKVVCQEVISRTANWFKRAFARRGVWARTVWAAGAPSAKPSSGPNPQYSRAPLRRGVMVRARDGCRPGWERR